MSLRTLAGQTARASHSHTPPRVPAQQPTRRHLSTSGGVADLNRVFLVRHGQSEGNINPALFKDVADSAIPLSKRGREQCHVAAIALRKHLRILDETQEKPKRRLWVSPYLRARQTAEIFMEHNHDVMDTKEHILLAEQDFGLFEGVGQDEAPVKFPAEWDHYQRRKKFGAFWARMPLGESKFDVCQRVHQMFGSFWRDASRDSDHITEIICVSHGATIKAFVMMWTQKTVEWFSKEPTAGNASIRTLVDGVDTGYLFPGFRE